MDTLIHITLREFIDVLSCLQSILSSQFTVCMAGKLVLENRIQLTELTDVNTNEVHGRKEEDEMPNKMDQDLGVMDYTPARRKTPIHNL